MKTPKTLLAKTPKLPDNPRYEETLVGHSEAVVECFKVLFGTRKTATRLGREWLRFFKIPLGEFHRFYVNGVTACALHDIGKANSGFDDAVNRRGFGQVVRHDHLGGFLLLNSSVRESLANIDFDWDIVVVAVIGHHLKVDAACFAHSMNADRNAFTVFSDGILDLVKIARRESGVSGPCNLTIDLHWTIDETLGEQMQSFKSELRNLRLRIAKDINTRRLMRAVRAALIIADAAGSGLPREDHPISEWLKSAFADGNEIDASYIDEHIIVPRKTAIEQETKKPLEWNDFQNAAEALPDRALLLASCGSGKTLAAWRWIKGQLARHPTARAIFLYPTRATATEGFRDYVSWAPEDDAAMIHGTSAYELQGMFNNVNDGRKDKDFTAEDRLFAIAYWKRRIFSATVDQFLGFMQYAYRSVCLLPVLVDSVVVIDEVHSFDRSLFSSLKRFLREFDIPVLCMTASLPTQRQRDLLECGLKVFPDKLQDFDDLQRLAEHNRYKVHVLDCADSARSVARHALSNGNGKRVLWVVNTVERCQQLACDLGAKCYHSRFTLDHRKDRHQAVIAAFKPTMGAVLAVTTQVCEMSLDLDAQVLVMEAAPVTAMIQRMGRCNRHARAEGDLGEVYVYHPENESPYEPEDWKGAGEFLAALNSKTVSQARLQELLEMFGPDEIEIDRYAAFVESGPWALSREASLRDDSGSQTKQAILDSDVLRYLDLREKKLPTDGLFLPAPWYLTRQNDRIGDYPSVAPAANYSSELGLLNRPVEAKT